MFGVCVVSYTWYEGSQNTRTSSLWWTGTTWVDRPVQVGPFVTREQAEAFAKSEKRSGAHVFTYGEGDAFGENAEYYNHQA